MNEVYLNSVKNTSKYNFNIIFILVFDVCIAAAILAQTKTVALTFI